MLASFGAAFIVFGGFVSTTQVWMDADVVAAFEKEKKVASKNSGYVAVFFWRDANK